MTITREDLFNQVEDLYKYRDLYIEEHSVSQAAQKPADVEKKMLEILQLVEENQSAVNNKAEYHMLKGKCLNVTSKYDPNAEEALSKAVKLDPKHVEAWNILGECFWKKGDIESAKNCFTGALQHLTNKVSLRNLSMVLRQFGSTREEKLQHINESVLKAKEAINLDISDGMSWFILGNAYLAQFFGGTQNDGIIKLCLKAYSQAEKDPVTKNNPDLHFNRSMCHLYQSDFNSALQGFVKAAELDPSWDIPSTKVDMLKKYIHNVFNMIQNKCSMTGKNKLQKILSSFGDSHLGPYSGGTYTSPLGKIIALEKRLFESLSMGLNNGVVVCGKVLGGLSTDQAVPYTFILIDENSACIAVCLYNVSTGYGVKAGDSVAIPEPYLMNVNANLNPNEDKADSINYNFIRVETPMVLVVNGKKLGLDKQAPAVLKVTAQSE